MSNILKEQQEMIKKTLRNQQGEISKIFGYGSTPAKRRKIPKGVKDDVWEEYNGKKYNGKCYVCKNPIVIRNFDVGHNRAVSKGGTTNKSNLRPICRKCNFSMGMMSIEQYKKKYYGKGKKVIRIAKKGKRRKKIKEGYLGTLPKPTIKIRW